MRNMMVLAAFAFVACGKGGEGDTCTTTSDCGSGLTCEATGTATTAESTCVATGTETMTETMETMETPAT